VKTARSARTPRPPAKGEGSGHLHPGWEVPAGLRRFLLLSTIFVMAGKSCCRACDFKRWGALISRSCWRGGLLSIPRAHRPQRGYSVPAHNSGRPGGRSCRCCGDTVLHMFFKVTLKVMCKSLEFGLINRKHHWPHHTEGGLAGLRPAAIRPGCLSFATTPPTHCPLSHLKTKNAYNSVIYEPI
jgi:hypothetical protein